jgi:hypothetical protein
MKTEIRYRVMWVNDYSQGEINQDDFYTRKNAEEYCKELSEDFKDQEYYVEEYDKVIRKSYAYPNSIDGWEDLYGN